MKPMTQQEQQHYESIDQYREAAKRVPALEAEVQRLRDVLTNIYAVASYAAEHVPDTDMWQEMNRIGKLAQEVVRGESEGA